MSNKMRIEGLRYPKAVKSPGGKRPRFVAPVRPRHLLWAVIAGGLWLGASRYGTPHLRFVYTYTGSKAHPHYRRCDYLGLHSRRVFPANGRCPLIVFFKAQES
jgi:hypothetical protein